MATYSSLSSLDTSKLAAGDVINVAYTGAAQSTTLPAGKYTLTCLGAQGGYRSSTKVRAKINGEWKKAKEIFAKVSGEWKKAKSLYVKQGGEWKKIFG